jgi:hypothetical protein
MTHHLRYDALPGGTYSFTHEANQTLADVFYYILCLSAPWESMTQAAPVSTLEKRVRQFNDNHFHIDII